MDLRLLGYFLAIADEGSVSAAAKVLRVAQPSLSRQLRSLELNLGQPLFDRSRKRLVLSAFGQAFLPIARELVQHAELVATSARALASGEAPRLTVAAPPATTVDIIAPFIASSGPQGAIVNAIQLAPEQIYNALRDGSADLALSTRVPPASFRWQLVGFTHPWAQCAPSYAPMTDADHISVAELVSWPLIVMTRDHAVRRQFDDAVARAGLSYDPVYETASNSVAQALAAAGRGICILSDHSRFGLRAIRVTSETGELGIPLYGAWDPRHFAADAIEGALSELGIFIERLYAIDPISPTEAPDPR